MKKDNDNNFKPDLIEKGVEYIIRGLGQSLSDPNFSETPERYTRFISELFYKEAVDYATFPEAYSDFLLFRGHQMWSLCPHHLLPVQFTCSVAYIPSTQVLGLSKLARVLDEANRQPLLQERFTKDVVDHLYANVEGLQGAACFIDGRHDCTRIRGVKSDGHFITYHTRGKLKETNVERQFLDLVMHL